MNKTGFIYRFQRGTNQAKHKKKMKNSQQTLNLNSWRLGNNEHDL